LTEPLRVSFKGASIIGTSPAEAFIVKLKTSLAFGILLSSPILFAQCWLFISPALHFHEKKLAVPFVFFGTVFFLVGVAFCFYLIFPYALQFFNDQFVSVGIEPTIKIGEYL